MRMKRLDWLAVGIALSWALIMPGLTAADALPWVESRLLYDVSTPALNDWRVESLVPSGEDRLAVLTRSGITLLRYGDGQWGRTVAHEIAAPAAAAWIGEKLVVIAADATWVFDQKDGVSRTVTSLACPAGARAAVGHVPGTTEALIMIGGRVHLLDVTAMTHRGIRDVSLPNENTRMIGGPWLDRLHVFGKAGLLVWDGDEERFEPWHDAEGHELDVDSGARSLSAHPNGRWLYAAELDPTGLITIDLESQRVYRAGPNHEVNWKSDAHVWRAAVDTRRNTLYLSTWKYVVALAPADDPTQWRVRGYLSTTSDPPVHANRAVGPTGGCAYLPQTDNLLVATRWGVSSFSTSASDQSRLVHDEHFNQFRLTPSDIPGKGPLYDFLREHKLRAMYTSASTGVSEESLDLFKQAGINAIFYQTFYYRHDEFYPGDVLGESLVRLARQCAEREIQFFVLARPFGISAFNHSGIHDYDYMPMILPSGEAARDVRGTKKPEWTRLAWPSPIDSGYWQRSIEAHLVELAELSRRVPIAGLFYEMGDAYSRSNHSLNPGTRNIDVSDSAWQRFLRGNDMDSDEALQVPAANWGRYHWLRERNLWQTYVDWQRREVAALARRSLAAAREVNPDFTVHVCLPEGTFDYDENWMINAFIDGFGSSSQPTIIASQQNYAVPFCPPISIYPGRRMQAAGQHIIYLPGLASAWWTPRELTHQADRLYHAAAGFWIYEGHSWERGAEAEHYRPLTPGAEGSYAVEDYVDALGKVLQNEAAH